MSIRDESRRGFTQSLGALALGSMVGACSTPRLARAVSRVVVIGGGFGGATAAKYLKLWGGDAIDVTLIERQPNFISCPLSNLVLSGALSLKDLTHTYAGLRRRGVETVQAEVTEIDPVQKRVRFAQGDERGYDKLVVAPGIDFMTEAIEGLDTEAGRTLVHAWRAGPQTLALRAQLEAMPDGGVFVIAIPKAPYRCPPGPYERVCQVARYFKTAKPRSKIIVLDGNPDITSKKALFMAAWTERYAGMIDYHPNSLVTEVDAAQRTLITEMGDKVRGDVLNLIPPQRGGDLARRAGLLNAGGRWATVDWLSLESTAFKDVHVIGDAGMAAPGMPKSGHMANQHGKAVAAALVEILRGQAVQTPTMNNTCYSFVDVDSAVHVASVHQWVAEKRTLEPVVGAGGVSSSASELEAAYAHGWARNIWADTLG